MKTNLPLIAFFFATMLHAQAPSDYVAYYEFNNNLNDTASSANMTTNGTAFSFSNNRSNYASSALNPNMDRLEASSVLTGVTTNASVSFWFRTITGSPQGKTLFQLVDQNNSYISMSINAQNRLVASIDHQESNLLSTQHSVTVTDGNWHHIVFTTRYDSGIGSYQSNVYIDGGGSGGFQNINFFANNSLFTTNTNLIITPNSTLNELIDDIQIYDRELSQAEAASIFNQSLPSRVYVNATANGNNDGSNWQDAYVSLQDALGNLPSAQDIEVWIARGRYTPDVSDRDIQFRVLADNVSFYGGFSGSEFALADRNMGTIHTVNATILSGDLNGDDNGTSNLTDNSHHVIDAQGNNFVIDGIIVSDGNSDQTSGIDRFGAGILSRGNLRSLTLRNSIIRNNTSAWGAGVYYAPTNGAGQSVLTIDACIFKGNRAGMAPSFYALAINTSDFTSIITNSLFNDNETNDTVSYLDGFGASAGWLRAINSSSTISAAIVNNTFVNNTNNGTSQSTFPVLGISQSGGGSISNLIFANNLFWNNRSNGSVSNAFGGVIDGQYSPANINNCLDEDNFSNHTNSNLNSILTANPNFVGTNNFRLQSSSPAIDAGNNGNVGTLTQDLAGNNRIINSTVDIGAYEFNPSACQNIVNIPDANFKAVLLDHGVGITGNNISVIDTDGDGEICQSEAQAYTGFIAASNQNISTLTGIEAFVNIVGLSCALNQLSTLNVSANVNLENLSCGSNQLSSLDVSALTSLQSLQCSENQLSTLNLSNNAMLDFLACKNNLLTSLDFSNNPLLRYLECNSNQLTSLDVSGLTQFDYLVCENNALTSLNVANGNNINFGVMSAINNPSLNCIQHDSGFDPTTNPYFDNVGQISGWRKDSTASWNSNCNLSTSDFSLLADLILYPNPAKSTLIVSSAQTEITKIEVYNLVGKKVIDTAELIDNTIDISQLNKGIYILKAYNNEQYAVKKLIKN